MIVYAGSARGHFARTAALIVFALRRPVTILPQKT